MVFNYSFIFFYKEKHNSVITEIILGKNYGSRSKKSEKVR